MTRRAGVLAGFAAAALIALVVGALCGAVDLGAGTILWATVHPRASDDANAILWSLRFPRLLAAAIVGAALALAGTLMQATLRNPLVDPYLTGGSAGAAFAIALAIAFGASAPAYSAIAFGAALGTTFVVAMLARTGTGIAPERLVLAGISLSSLFAALTTLVILFTPSTSASLSILAWLGGSLVGHGWRDVGWSLGYAVVGIGIAAATVPALNALRLGHERAASLGVDVDRARWSVIVATSLLTAAAVSISGVIGFVGLIVPHVVRAAIGTDLRWTLVASIPAGATVVVLADTLARSVAPPLELPVGILLSIIGVPAFLYLAARRWRFA